MTDDLDDLRARVYAGLRSGRWDTMKDAHEAIDELVRRCREHAALLAVRKKMPYARLEQALRQIVHEVADSENESFEPDNQAAFVRDILLDRVLDIAEAVLKEGAAGD